MSKVEIQLFGAFQVLLNGKEIILTPSVEELLALLVVVGDYRLKAKGLCRILYEPKGIKYNATLYTMRLRDLKSELKYHNISDLLITSDDGVRFCKLDLQAFHCDYYDMLSGKIPLGAEEDFLPEYEWAKGFYQKDWQALYKYWKSLHVV